MIKPALPAPGLDEKIDPRGVDAARMILNAVLLDLPPGTETDSALAEAYAAWGTPDPFGSFVVGPGKLLANMDREQQQPLRASFLVWDSADYSVPYQAQLTWSTTLGWVVDWLASQCASCFGDGIAEGMPCGTCGGSGWGTLDSSEHSVAPRLRTGNVLRS